MRRLLMLALAGLAGCSADFHVCPGWGPHQHGSMPPAYYDPGPQTLISTPAPVRSIPRQMDPTPPAPNPPDPGRPPEIELEAPGELPAPPEASRKTGRPRGVYLPRTRVCGVGRMDDRPE